jgi:hypothetical protein
MDIERREFIKRAGITGLALLTGCATSGTEIKEPEANIKESGEFDSEKFLRWYKRNKLYNGPNPNLKGPHYHFETFKECLNKSVTPGVSYSAPWGEVMVAVAPGVVQNIGEISGTGRPGGGIITIGYVHNEQNGWPRYKSDFDHVGGSLVKVGQAVIRGQPICHVPMEYQKHVKLVFKEGDTLADPDGYGRNHGYMTYAKGQEELDELFQKNREDYMKITSEKFSKQRKILDQFLESAAQEKIRKTKWHNLEGYKPSDWSRIEQFCCLSTLYDMYPTQFPNLTQEEFEAMKKEFYANQPIILTLPFKKGGFR